MSVLANLKQIRFDDWSATKPEFHRNEWMLLLNHKPRQNYTGNGRRIKFLCWLQDTPLWPAADALKLWYVIGTYSQLQIMLALSRVRVLSWRRPRNPMTERCQKVARLAFSHVQRNIPRWPTKSSPMGYAGRSCVHLRCNRHEKIMRKAKCSPRHKNESKVEVSWSALPHP